MHSNPHARSQHNRSKSLLVFGIARIIAWTLLGAFVILGMFHVELFGWAFTLAKSVPFVAIISVYANWATDLDGATAAYAALVAASAHEASSKGSGDVG